MEEINWNMGEEDRSLKYKTTILFEKKKNILLLRNHTMNSSPRLEYFTGDSFKI